MPLSLTATCGQLLVVGFHGLSLPGPLARALASGERGGVVMFKRNIATQDANGETRTDIAAVAALSSEVARAASASAPPLVAVDQEGGRVARLGAPVLRVPPMRAIGARGDLALAERVAHAQARELAALGFTMSFAPVLDTDTCATNPIIGDRAFSSDAAQVAAFGEAWINGMRRGGVLSCGKHFPGHGDTTKDSHVDLPIVDVSRERLDAVELVPFARAARAGVDAMMSAHVVYSAIDAKTPATLSRVICTEILREKLGFRGVLFSDDLEMRAIADRYGFEESAVLAIAAGCDALLVCSRDDLAARAHEALVREAEKSESFRERCVDACGRVLRMRSTAPPQPVTDRARLAAIVGGEASRAIAKELA
jgi:beta-N-acetylhexosaminidase